MKTREEAEQRAMELYPPNIVSIKQQQGFAWDEDSNLKLRKAYLQCWEDMQQMKRECTCNAFSRLDCTCFNQKQQK